MDVGSARYLAGYIQKKLTHRDDSRLYGRHPEFARMSLRPGIGSEFMWEVASTLLGPGGSAVMAQADVPSALRVGSKIQPLGRYLRKQLRKKLGRDEKAPEAAIREYQAEVLPLLEASKKNEGGLKAEVLARYRQKILNQKSKSKLYDKGRKKL